MPRNLSRRGSSEGANGLADNFGSGGGFERHRPNGFGGRRGKLFAAEELRLMVLRLLGEQPQHGYQLIRGFAERSGDNYSPSPGILYPTLSLLADQGLVKDRAGEQKSRRVFELTEEGRAEVEFKSDEIDAAFTRMASIAENASKTNVGPVKRAMANLRTAAIQKITSENANDQTAFAIAALIDEAAQKVERL